MKIPTKFHGKIDIQPEQLWEFPKGIPGFENKKKFILLPIEGNNVFQVLQSATTASVAFIVANPYTIMEDYSFDVDEPTVELLGIEKEEDVFILAVLSLKERIDTSTINLQAPLIFQKHTKKAKQMILNDNTFSLRHPIGTLAEVE
ncbi:flagellar assembly protein FliW [Sporosarcina sp. HYO08]|uniref:flagellar assembly protein FliW n=1 Tax=Sporosarcina sp. HYO08 TaxID=1759557 RepID=UPI000799FC73|nr:flagellar assembly protein FliW [Sporosarcina sp. HYO08]KXH84140.1 flagellar assembly protein FliW [Sporosarcina sp. HYO08]